MKDMCAITGAHRLLTWLMALALGVGACLGLVACNRQSTTTPILGGASGPSSGAAGIGAASVPSGPASAMAPSVMPGASTASMPR